MIGRISELVLTPKCAPQKQLRIAFVSEAEPPVKLHGTVASKGEGLAALSLGHSDSFFYLVVVLLSDQRCRAVKMGTAGFHGQQNLYRRVLERLIAAYVLIELFARGEVIDNHMKHAGQTAGHLCAE